MRLARKTVKASFYQFHVVCHSHVSLCSRGDPPGSSVGSLLPSLTTAPATGDSGDTPLSKPPLALPSFLLTTTAPATGTVARRCISANAIHFPSSIELDIRYFAIRYTVFNAAVTAASLRSPKPRFRSVQRCCAHRNPGFALCSGAALTETQVSLCAAVLRSPKPRFRSVQSHCTHSMLLMYSHIY